MYQAHFNLAKLLTKRGRSREAVAHFREAVAANPEFAAGQLYLAKALLDAGDLQAAELAARQGMARRPPPDIAPLGHYTLADIYARLGREADSAREAAAGRRLEHARRDRQSSLNARPSGSP
jgi:tetratricopeptide (TPR) repeat protein